MNHFDFIEKLIAEHGSSGILKERLTAIKEELARIIKDRDQYRKQADDFQNEVSVLRAEIEKYKKKNGFVEHRGALFKRKAAGGYDVAVYCPVCFGPMSSLQGITNFACGKDKTRVNFTGDDLPKILKELPNAME